MGVAWGLGVPQDNALSGFMRGVETGRQHRRENELMQFRREQMEEARADRKTASMEAEQQRIAQAAQTLGPVYQQLSRMPYEQRRQWLQQVAPRLVARGIPEEVITSYDPTDQNLQVDMALSQRVASESFTLGENQVRFDSDGREIARGPAARPRYYPIAPGGRLELDPSYQTSEQPQEVTATNPQTGERLRLNPQTGQWEPIQGGPAPAAGPATFPGQW